MRAGTLWQRLWRGAWRAWSGGTWARLTDPHDHEYVMTVPVTDRHHAKQGRSTGRVIWRDEQGTVRFYLKRHFRLPVLHGVLATLWPNGDWSPAAREARHLAWARAHGLAVPKTLACGECIGPRGRLRSFLALEELTGYDAANELLPVLRGRMSASKFDAWKRRQAGSMASIVAQLHAKRHYHKDLYLCHFFVRFGDETTYLIDLHRLGHHGWTGWRWRVKDLAQLLFSADLPEIDDRDRLRFFHAYVGRKKLRWADRRLLHAIQRKAGRYRRHNGKRQPSVVVPYVSPEPAMARRAS